VTTVVVDASVLVAAVLSADPHCAAASRFLEHCLASDVALAVPTLARAEVACALSRRSGDPTTTLDLVTSLFVDRGLTEQAVDAPLAAVAARAGSMLGLRGADACYLALAVLLDAPLITLDRELIARAGGITPAAWLRLHSGERAGD